MLNTPGSSEPIRLLTKITGCVYTNGSYTMMTKPIRALELHYPMIPFLIILNTQEHTFATFRANFNNSKCDLLLLLLFSFQ